LCQAEVTGGTPQLSAIAIAGFALYHGGGHEIRDIAVRGSTADYLVDEENHLLEIADPGKATSSQLGDKKCNGSKIEV
jgi:hypothetical protein